METCALLRRTGLGLAGSALALSLIVAASRADELAGAGTTPAAAGIVIHGAEETLRDHCRFEDGALWFHLPSGTRFELVTSTGDPAIANPGDGSFHPFEAAEVRAALDALRFPLAGIACEIWILPYPRRSGLESAAGPGIVILSPAVLPIPRERQHAETVHELGHVVHHARMPDEDIAAWDRYRALRGITDAGRFSAEAAHADRPHEIFAEDFRALFGGALANASGTIENPSLAPPSEVPGLAEFLFGLAGVTPGGPVLAAWPNPSSGAVRLAIGGAPAGSMLDVYDATGRRIASLAAAVAAGAPAWEWDGRAGDGTRVAPGVYFARVRSGGGTARLLRVR